MADELEIFTTAASTDVFFYLSAVFALCYAAWVIWVIGQKPALQAQPVSLVRRAL